MNNQQDLKPGELPEGFTVVKFSTPNCGPCKMLTPKFDSLDYGDKVNLVSINPQTNMEWITELTFNTVPTTIGFIDGEEVFRVSGSKIEAIVQEIESRLEE